MNFLEKIGISNNAIDFLKDYGFEKGTCGYGCCNGLKNTYQSGHGYYYNIVVVSEYYGNIHVTNHNEYSCGGEVDNSSEVVDKINVCNESILRAINDVLPRDLD